MKITLALEELAMLMLGIFVFSQLDFAWWWFLVLFFTPDFGMLGYLFNTKIGAFTYNLFHHRGLAILIWILGFYLQNEVFQLIGVILFSHVAFDRILGYGLKYEKGFKFTHLGEIGN
ncbi:DUF4260 domain-containing protein [Salegentibacter maritimus]|uniref:DUF4260 domain-containing protein n=1 Tax=Salegentibacter maritimus TaxID=2794347 RepID=A0ABS0TC19_9FLAO|nr:DUF4260 domain-containing protein [Salegentibacter maritimus]MBI6118582.1 DUF4260 domain-containing protein [Salegentibacter maritimus]